MEVLTYRVRLVTSPRRKARQTQPSRRAQRRILGVGGAERHFTRSIAIAWNAEISRVAQIRAESDGVIAHDFGPVIHHLILVLGLQQMAVARVYLQTRTETGQSVAAAVPLVLFMKKPGAPAVKVVPVFSPGMPAMVARSSVPSYFSVET